MIDLKDLSGLQFVGILSLRDKLRDLAYETIMQLRSAGISVIMVTGDHYGTARYVARKAGIIFGQSKTADEIAKERGISILEYLYP